MAEKIQAIVIKSNDRKEKDKNILLFSLEQGKIWATLKGVKSPKAKMKAAQNPFCFGEFVLEDGKTGKIITGFEAIENFHELSEDIDKFFEASAILEIINCFDFDSKHEIGKFFVLTLKALKSLCFGQAKSLYTLNKFLVELFSLSGFPLYGEKCSCCGNTIFENLYINYLVGELVCSACKNYSCEMLSKPVYAALKFINNNDFEKLKTIRLAEGSEKALLKILVKNFEVRFEKKLNMIGILS